MLCTFLPSSSRLAGMVLLLGLAGACSEPTESAGGPGAPNGAQQPGDPNGAGGANGGGGGGGGSWDQAALSKTPAAIKVTGNLSVANYTKGSIQMDIHAPTADRTKGEPPLTVVRIQQPGPFEIYLPEGTAAVKISTILDFEGNGPDQTDLMQEYSGNPIDLTKGNITLDIALDAATASGSSQPTTPNPASPGTGAEAGSPNVGALASPPPAGVPPAGVPPTGAPPTGAPPAGSAPAAGASTAPAASGGEAAAPK